MDSNRRHLEFAIGCDVIVRHLSCNCLYLFTEEVQFGVRKTNLVTRQIKKLLFDGFDGIVGVDSLGKKDDLYLVLLNCI